VVTWPTQEQLDAYLALPQDDPVVMLNLLTFKDEATGESQWLLAMTEVRA
jgi:hypothetical protein